ncbi:MAG: class I SAM-dependent methyltransferase [Gaiellaceae bacterium]
MSSAVTATRWLSAQEAERTYWSALSVDADEIVRVLVEKAAIARRIDRLIPARARAGDVVELGVGPLGVGCLHFLLPQPDGDLIGLDPIPLMAIDELAVPEPLDALVRACRAMRYRHVEATGEETGLPTGAFALAVSYNMLDHVRDPGAVLRETHRILKQDGMLVLGCDTVSVASRLRYDLYLTRRYAGELGVRAHTFRFSARTLESMVRDAGFRIESFDERPRRALADLVGRSQRVLLTAVREP